MENIWQAIKSILGQSWIEHGLLHLFFLGLVVAIILSAILITRSYKEDIKNKKESRKRGKQTLKFLSNKKNKTY